MIWLGYALGLLAAVSNAGASLLQRVANRDEGADRQFSWRLVVDLLHKPVWFGGIAFMTASFFLQATGLGLATLAAVEPLLVLELPLTLLGARLWLGSPMDGRARLGVIGMTAGTVALIAFLDPRQGRTHGISWVEWVVAIAVSVGAIGACVVYGRMARRDTRRAAVLGIGTGIGFGLAAALMKGMATQFGSGGVVGVLEAWQLYATIAAGVLAVWLQQNAVGSQRLLFAQPGITLSDPYTSIGWGAAVFHEQMRGGIWVLLAVLAGVVMSVSAVVLSRSGSVFREQS